MENIIRDHLVFWDVFSTIYPSYNFDLLKEKNKLFLLFRNFSECVKWEYKKESFQFYFVETLFLNPDEITSFQINYDISLMTNERNLCWDENGKLIEETYFNDDGEVNRSINYINEGMIIDINGIIYIYNLKSVATDIIFNLTLSNLEKYQIDVFKKITEGKLDLVNPDFHAIFYIDDVGTVNAVTISGIIEPDIYSSLVERLLKYDPSEIKEDAEKLRIDFKRYNPKLFN